MMFAQARSGSYIVSKEAVQKVGSKEYGADPIGSGPFVFDHYTPKQEVVLEANKDYFLGSPWLDRITYKMIEEEITRNVALENGEVDIQIALSEMEAIERFMQNPDIEVIRATSSLWAYGIAINVEMEPFTDLRVRKAIQYAIDVPAIIEALFGTEGRALPANSPFAPSAEGWNPGLKWHEHYERDLDKARSLLAEAGYPNGFSTTFVTHSFLQHEKIFTAIKDQLEDIDIDVTIEVVDVATWRAHMTAKDVAGIPIASNSRMLWSTFVYPDGPDAACKYSGCNELFQKAWVEPDPIKRSELYRSIQQKLLEDAPYIPLFYDYQMSAIRKGLRNFESPQFISDGFRLYWESSGD